MKNPPISTPEAKLRFIQRQRKRIEAIKTVEEGVALVRVLAKEMAEQGLYRKTTAVPDRARTIILIIAQLGYWDDKVVHETMRKR